MLTTTLAAPGWKVDPATNAPIADLFPGTLRLLTPFLNVTGGLCPRVRRGLLGLRLHAEAARPGLLAGSRTSPATSSCSTWRSRRSRSPVNFVASLPGAIRALLAGRLHSRVPATILIAIGAFLASSGDILARFGVTEFFVLGKLIAVVFLFLGFLVSVEAFSEWRVPVHPDRPPPPAGRAGRRPGNPPPEHLTAPAAATLRPVTLPRARLGGTLAIAVAACLFGTLGPGIPERVRRRPDPAHVRPVAGRPRDARPAGDHRGALDPRPRSPPLEGARPAYGRGARRSGRRPASCLNLAHLLGLRADVDRPRAPRLLHVPGARRDRLGRHRGGAAHPGPGGRARPRAARDGGRSCSVARAAAPASSWPASASPCWRPRCRPSTCSSDGAASRPSRPRRRRWWSWAARRPASWR